MKRTIPWTRVTGLNIWARRIQLAQSLTLSVELALVHSGWILHAGGPETDGSGRLYQCTWKAKQKMTPIEARTWANATLRRMLTRACDRI